MPELPEVETIKRDLADLITGEKILNLETDSFKQVQPSFERVKKTVLNQKIKKVLRRAKIILIYLENGSILAFHLKLTGRLLFRKKEDKKDEWQHVTFGLSHNKELRFADLRKFGWVKLIENEKDLQKIFLEFGPEPLDDLTFSHFEKILKGSRRPVKIVIMDQKKISGIGNIYASDALLLAKVNPKRSSNEISKKEAKKLFEAIEKVLKAGIKYRGASDQHYLDALGHKGSYQKHFLAYGQTNEICLQCKKGKIKKFFLGGRGTYFCPNCQKL